MPDGFNRSSVLAKVAVPGRFGADHGVSGVVLTVLAPPSLVLVMARAGKAKSVATALGKLPGARMMWAGPDQWYVQGPSAAEIKAALKGAASVVDQSHGRVSLLVAGPKARAVLAKGTPVDLHPNHFAVGRSAVTQMAHVGVHLTRTGDDVFELSIFRGFAESFWEWLTEMSLEFGYQVR